MKQLKLILTSALLFVLTFVCGNPSINARFSTIKYIDTLTLINQCLVLIICVKGVLNLIVENSLLEEDKAK